MQSFDAQKAARVWDRVQGNGADGLPELIGM